MSRGISWLVALQTRVKEAFLKALTCCGDVDDDDDHGGSGS